MSVRGEREGGRVRHTVQGVLLFLFSLSPTIAPWITPIYMPEEYFNIRYTTPPPSLRTSLYLLFFFAMVAEKIERERHELVQRADQERREKCIHPKIIKPS